MEWLRATSSSDSASVLARGFSTSVGMPRERKVPATSWWSMVGTAIETASTRSRRSSVVSNGAGGELVGDALSLLGPRIDHCHEFHLGHAGENSGMVLAQMSHAHDADSQPFHVQSLPRSAAPPMVALLLDLDEIEQAADFWTKVAVRLENLGGMLGCHSSTDRAADVPRAGKRSSRR